MKSLSLLLIVLFGVPLGSLAAAELGYRVTDSSGKPIPAKLTFQTEDGKDPSKIKIETRIPYWASRGPVVYTLPGDVPIPVPAGKYRVYVSHGFEWSLAMVDVEVPGDGAAALNAVLERVVDTKGYISGDMHLHTLTFSGHGDTNVEERIISLCAEDVEWAVATDHNHVTDYVPYVKKVGAEKWILTTPGNEVTTTLIGHFNAFPFNPSLSPTDWRISDPRELFHRMRAEGAEVVQINHPRWTGARGAYFRDLDVSPYTGDSSNPRFSDGFDSFEVLNGNDLHGWVYRPDAGTGVNPQFDYSVRDDWYNFLNLGLTFTAVGNSDSHHVNAVVAGCPRNYIKCTAEETALVDPRELMASVKAGRVSVSTGIFVEAWVGDALPGSLVSIRRVPSAPDGAEGTLPIGIRVQAAPWIRADRVVVVANGEEVSVTPLSPPGGATVLRYEGVYRDRPARDTWYVVYAIADEAPVPVQHKTAFPLGFTNPIRVDADGDGHFTPLREHARREAERAVRSGDFSALRREAAAFRRQALGALREVEAAGAAPEAIVRGLDELVRDSDPAVRAGAASLLAVRPERSALLALLGARASIGEPMERARFDFELVRAGHLPALRDLKASYEASKGFERYTIRRDIHELARKTRIVGWKVAGPYPSSRWGDGLEAVFPPEGAEPSSEIRWRPTSTDKKGFLSFRDTMDPRHHAAAFARLRVRARERISTALLVDSDNALRILVNRCEVFRQAPPGAGDGDLTVVPATFSPGENEVLVKCVVERGSWGFQLLAVDPLGALEPGEG